MLVVRNILRGLLMLLLRSEALRGTFVHRCRFVVIPHPIPSQRRHGDTMTKLDIPDCQWLKEFRHVGNRCWYGKTRADFDWESSQEL
jgi:hypothetical protein